MAFRGDIAQIPLSNILQALMMNGQEGILTLESESFRSRLFILQIGVRPLNYQTDTPDLLKHIVLKQKLLTESQFQNIFSTWVPGSCHPGDFLINRRILSEETVEHELRQQLEDFIYEIFLIPKLKYEFSAGADSTEHELFAPSGLGQSLIFNANSILMETVRREDEWSRFREQIPSAIEIYALNNVTDEDFEKVPLPQEKVQEVRTLVDGETTVTEIVNSSVLSGFDVYEILWNFKQADLISPLNLEEKLDLANRLRKSLRPKDAISIYRSILLNDPDNTAIRRQLITLLIKCKAKGSDLVDHYLHLASQLANNDPDQARQYLENALSIAPHNIQALEKLFELYALSAKNRDALNVARTLVAAAKEELDPEASINLLYRMINFYPEEVGFYHEIAELQVAVNDLDGAVECLKSAADIYRQRKDFTKLRKTYEKIARLRPSESHHLKRIKEEEKKAQRSRTYLMKFAVTSLVLCVVAGFALIIGINEHRAREVYWNDVHGMVTVLKHLDAFEEARTILSEFKRTFPWSTVTKNAQALALELEELERESADEHRTQAEIRRYEARTQLAKAKFKHDERKFAEALSILNAIDRAKLSEEENAEFNRVLASIRKYMQTALDYENKARKALQDGDVRTAHRLRKAIWVNFADSPVAKGLRLPIRIETTPPGVNLILNGKIVGKTPKVLLVDPESTPKIVLARPGYKLLSLDRALIDGKLFRPLDMSVVAVSLAKDVRWKYQAGGAIECFPAVRGDYVYVGTRDGVVHAVKRDGKLAWTFEVDFGLDITGGLGQWNNLLYFGASNGLFYVLNAQTGALVRKVSNATKDLQPITAAPSTISDTPITFVNCGRALSAIDISTGNVVWVQYFQQSRLVGQPLAVRGHVYVTTDTGAFLQISRKSGDIEKTYAVAAPSLSQPGQIHGRRAYFVDGGHTVHSLDLDTWKRSWVYEVKDGLTSALTVDSDHVIVPTRKWLICLTSAGAEAWRTSLHGITGDADDEITAQGTIFRNTYICGTRNGRVLCFDLTSGTVVWSYKTESRSEGGFHSRLTIQEGYLYLGSVGSDGGTLFCIAVD